MPSHLTCRLVFGLLVASTCLFSLGHAESPSAWSRFHGADGRGDAGNNAKLLAALGDLPPEQRGARFQCVLVYMRHALDPTPLVCQASWEGRILTEARGEHGFGYDPLFYVPDHDCSSAQLPPEVKNRISHRARASALLLEALRHP